MKIITISFLLCALLVIPQLQTDVEAEEQYACVKKQNGQFRLVDDPADCRPSEYSWEFEIKDNAGNKGEICWTNAAEDCILKLKFNSDDTLFSFFGSEICDGDPIIESYVYGSGFRNEGSDAVKIGLTFNKGGELLMGRVFIMDLNNGLGLCDVASVSFPCIEEDTYTVLDCSLTVPE